MAWHCVFCDADYLGVLATVAKAAKAFTVNVRSSVQKATVNPLHCSTLRTRSTENYVTTPHDLEALSSLSSDGNERKQAHTPAQTKAPLVLFHASSKITDPCIYGEGAGRNPGKQFQDNTSECPDSKTSLRRSADVTF